MYKTIVHRMSPQSRNGRTNNVKQMLNIYWKKQCKFKITKFSAKTECASYFLQTNARLKLYWGTRARSDCPPARQNFVDPTPSDWPQIAKFLYFWHPPATQNKGANESTISKILQKQIKRVRLSAWRRPWCEALSKSNLKSRIRKIQLKINNLDFFNFSKRWCAR